MTAACRGAWSTVTRSGCALHRWRAKGALLMGCYECCDEREIADKLLPGVPIGCFPDLYKAALRQHAGPCDHALMELQRRHVRYCRTFTYQGLQKCLPPFLSLS